MGKKIALYLEIDRQRSINARLIYALQCAGVAIDAALKQQVGAGDQAYCPRCEMMVATIDDGETCAECKLVL